MVTAASNPGRSRARLLASARSRYSIESIRHPTALVVVGAPVGSLVFVDGVQSGQAKQIAKQPQEVEVTPGTHVLEVRMGDTVAYRENTYVTPGEKRVISVLSGTGRN